MYNCTKMYANRCRAWYKPYTLVTGVKYQKFTVLTPYMNGKGHYKSIRNTLKYEKSRKKVKMS